MTTLAILDPIDPGTGERVTVRVCASQSADATGADGQVWWPAITSEPTIQIALFDGDFTSAVEPASASIEIRLDVLRNSGLFPRVERYDWAGASATIYRLVNGAPVLLASMRVDRFATEDFVLALALSVDTEPFETDVLFNKYAGTTGAEGGADLKDRPKPWAFGRCLNVEPVFIDQIDNVFQVSGYGPVEAISAVYERGASFGASVGDFANYAALVAADIPEGRWGTCLAEGMFRLGAPPAGVITCDVDGDNTGGFLRRTGAIIKQIASRLSLSGSVDGDSFDALDSAVARNVNVFISEQVSLIDLARRLVAPCNAVAGVGLDGKLIAPRVAFGTESMVLDAQGRQMPPVLGMARRNTSPPYKRIQMGAARSWRVHTFDEIAFFADLIDRGLYSASEVYREGNIVETADKARWVYVNPTASSGNAPPTWPTASNAFWSNIAPPIGGDLIGSIVAPANANRVPFSLMERDQGWEAASALTLSSSYGETAGLRYFRASATASTPGEAMVLRHLRRFALTPGTRVSVQARIGTEGASSDDWRLVLRGFDASGADSVIAAFEGRQTLLTEDGGSLLTEDGGALLLESSPPPGLRALTDEAVRFFADVPAGIVFGRLEVEGMSAGAGAFATALAEPMVTSAAAFQAVHPPFSPGPNALDGADVSLFVSGPVSHTFSYDAAGNLDPAGQMPRDFVFQLRTLAGQITSGVTWQYKIVSGAVNGFGAGPSLRAMSGAGTLTVSSLGSNSAEIEVIASSANGAAAARLRLEKSFAAPPVGGVPGGANSSSQTSGFTPLAAGDTSFVTVSRELEVTAGTSSGEASVNIQIAPGAATGLGGASFECLIERWNGTAWVSEGGAVSGTAISYLDAEGQPYDEPASFVFARSFATVPEMLAEVRLRARRSGGASVGGLISGSLVLTA